MPFNIHSFLADIWDSIFRAAGTPARLSRKRTLLLLFLLAAYPFWNLYIRLGFFLDRVFYARAQHTEVQAPIFVVGNYRSGSTFFHRLLLRDEQFSCLKAWEIYFAPGITHRKFIRGLLRISSLVGSPLQKLVDRFDRMMNEVYPMHKTGLRTYEQDSQLFYHTWSSYNLFAIFPFPERARRYIYYDRAVPAPERKRQFGFYRQALRRHLTLHPGRRYLAKNPDFSGCVETLLEFFPDAKFINLVRPAEYMIPSSINLWAGNWYGYGDPEETYPLIEVIKEHARHWYVYPHQQLSRLPEDRYQVVFFENLVSNPRAEISRIYQQFGLELSREMDQILIEETELARNYTGQNEYDLDAMGVDRESLRREFAPVLEQLYLQVSLQEKKAARVLGE